MRPITAMPVSRLRRRASLIAVLAQKQKAARNDFRIYGSSFVAAKNQVSSST